MVPRRLLLAAAAALPFALAGSGPAGRNGEPVLDAKLSRDPRNADHPFRLATAAPRRRRLWREGVCLNQWGTGACVGFAWTGMLLAAPVPPRRQPTEQQGNRYARRVFNEALRVDSLPGEDKATGTDTAAGAKILQRRGLIEGYRWCATVDDIIDAVITQGPVVLTVPWYRSMNQAPNGQVVVRGARPQNIDFYHCLLVTGYDPSRNGVESLRWRNSWGQQYGSKGSAWISVADMHRLFDSGWPDHPEVPPLGEACVAIGRKPVTIPRPKDGP